jgi:hypothetical protein
MVAGEIPYDQYFRWPLLLEGHHHQCSTFYVQWGDTSSSTTVTSFDARGPTTETIPLHRLPAKLGNLDLLIFNYPLRSVVRAFCLKHLLHPTLCSWDYFDDFYYGNKTLPKRVLTSMWQKMCDRVLVLSPTLLPRFHNSLHWDNASSLTPKQGSGNPRPIVGTIASLDQRFDRVLYNDLIETMTDHDFHLYGRIHNYRNRSHRRVRRFQHWLTALSERPNFKYFGPYSHQQLQDIVSSFDIGLIPYVPGSLCEHINPDKYYHYTNAGVPVLSAPIPSLLRRGNILFYSGLEDLLQKVRLITEGLQVMPPSTQFNWGERLVDILNVIDKGSPR